MIWPCLLLGGLKILGAPAGSDQSSGRGSTGYRKRYLSSRLGHNGNCSRGLEEQFLSLGFCLLSDVVFACSLMLGC